jgi:hypothetical protein
MAFFGIHQKNHQLQVPNRALDEISKDPHLRVAIGIGSSSAVIFLMAPCIGFYKRHCAKINSFSQVMKDKLSAEMALTFYNCSSDYFFLT